MMDPPSPRGCALRLCTLSLRIEGAIQRASIKEAKFFPPYYLRWNKKRGNILIRTVGVSSIMNSIADFRRVTLRPNLSTNNESLLAVIYGLDETGQ